MQTLEYLNNIIQELVADNNEDSVFGRVSFAFTSYYNTAYSQE